MASSWLRATLMMMVAVDLGVQHDRDGVQAEFLDRMVEHDLAAIEPEAARGGGVGDVARGDRAVERAAVGGGANHHEVWPSSLAATVSASFFASRLRASSWARSVSKRLRLAVVARSALPWGSRKLRA